MINWLEVLKFANNGNPSPDKKVTKTEEEWKSELTPEVFRITRLKGTERAHSSEMCGLFEPGLYACSCCNTLLFDANEKFESGTGWPSFTQPIKPNAIAYHKDKSYGMYRIEVTCNTCDAHLGHVFQDGPPPSGLRYCVNALSLEKQTKLEKSLVIGGGCFWCTEAVFQRVRGVSSVKSGYSGGKIKNPTYKEISSGLTEHAEVVQISYNDTEISLVDLIKIHLTTHDPTTLNRQGADRGTQYRSIIFYQNEEERNTINGVIEEVQKLLDDPIVTELKELEIFYPAEDYHQDYYNQNTNQGYCRAIINPKLAKFKKLYADKLKKSIN